MICIKTKIVFVTQKMVMGGIEKALLAMLDHLPPNRFDITVIVMEQEGDLINHVPSHVKIIPLFTNEKRIYEKVWDHLVKRRITQAFKTIFYTILLKKNVKSIYDSNNFLSKTLPYRTEKYDLAVAYHIPTSFSVTYVVNNIHSRKKIAWIHSDVSDADEILKVTEEGIRVRYSDDDEFLSYPELLKKFRKVYDQYDQIFCVSNYSVMKFKEVFPHMANKTTVFYNIINEKQLNLLAETSRGFHDDFDGIRILTVGRLGWEKGQDIIPNILLKLESEGYHIRWYCIGDGALRQTIETMIQKNSLEHKLILLGKIDNPYPFVKECDIYVQPSRQEGYCITLAEARALNKPIVTTNTGASEQIENEQTGLIVPFNVMGMSEGIKRLIDDQSLRRKFIQSLKGKTADTTSEINKFYELV